MAKRIVIVGGGIIGASIAYHLALRGAEVTVLDEDELGGVATSASWGWINASTGNPEPYARLRMHSMRLWHRLDRAVPGLDLRWTGGLMWDLAEAELAAYEEEHTSWGYPVRIVDRSEAARLEPNIADPPRLAAHVEVEGSVEPRQAARALLNDAVSRGACVLPRVKVEGIAVSGGRAQAVASSAGRIAADEIVVAAGVATPALLSTGGVSLSLRCPPGQLVVTRPVAPLLRGLVMAPGLHMRQRRDGAVVAGESFGGSDPREEPRAAAEACLSKVRAMLKPVAALELDHYTIGARPTPTDGFPAVGRPAGIDGLYVAAMHSGVTLAPAIGRFASDELLDGRRDAMLEGYGMDRFA